MNNKMFTQTDIYDVIPDVNNCQSGALKDSEKQKILAKVNSIRALHGLKPVTYNYSKDVNAQSSALITAANENLSHTPPANWKCYTAAGATGSENSNLFIKWYFGSSTPKSEETILGWMMDQNVDVCGHRRWLIDPFLKFIAFGRVDGVSKNNPQFNVLGASIYVIDSDKQNLLDWNDDFVAYPFHNYPTELVFDNKNAYWLFSFTAVFDKTDWWSNKNVSYANATLEIKDAANQVVSYTDLSSNNEGYGVPNALKWRIPSVQKEMTYTVTIKNVSFGANTKDYTYWFKITDQAGTPPPAPTLVLPSNGATNQNTELALSWNPAGDATSYNVQVARDVSFSQIQINQSNISLTSFAATGLAANTKYYWRVSGTNIAGDGSWSEVWNFTTKANAGNRPLLSEPKDLATSVSTTPVLKWSAVTGATAYEVIISDVITFPTASIIFNQPNIPGTTYTIPKNVLVENTRYWWKVRTNGSLGNGNWSDPFSFWTWILGSVNSDNDNSIISVVPNPANEVITISSSVRVDNSALFNTDGLLIRQLTINGDITTQNISDLPAGVYYIVFLSQSEMYVKKLTVIR